MVGLVFLFPLDGTDATEQAVARATRYVAMIPGSLARLLVVIDEGFDKIAHESKEGIELRIERQHVFGEVTKAKEVAARAEALCRRAGVATETHIRHGKPYDRILEECRLADVLVMHSLEPHRATEILRGSMTERILRHARCHVLLMHPAPPRSADDVTEAWLANDPPGPGDAR